MHDYVGYGKAEKAMLPMIAVPTTAGTGTETAKQGAAERLPSILMTALVTALGLLPLALGGGEPGREIEGPMAAIIVGGLVTSTILNLLILPTLLFNFGRFRTHQQDSGAWV